MMLRPLSALLALQALLALPLGAAAATPTPPPSGAALKARLLAPAAPKKQPPLSKVPLHAEYVVAVNGKGEVTRVVSKKWTKNVRFDVLTYGNAVQTFIREDNGTVVVGTFRLLYDYNPQRDAIRRDVALVQRGGVDANAESAVSAMTRKAAAFTKRDQAAYQKYVKAHPAAATPKAGENKPLPDLNSITGPSASPSAAH